MTPFRAPCLVFALATACLASGCQTLPPTGPVDGAPDWFNAQAAVAASTDFKEVPAIPQRPPNLKSDREWASIARDLERANARLSRSGGEAAPVDDAALGRWIDAQTARLEPPSDRLAGAIDDDPLAYAAEMSARTVPPPNRGS